jgi:hypothetical protein
MINGKIRKLRKKETMWRLWELPDGVPKNT